MDVLILSILHHTQESGYTFKIGDVEQTVFGTICVISADNPANNLLGGFKETSAPQKAGSEHWQFHKRCMDLGQPPSVLAVLSVV